MTPPLSALVRDGVFRIDSTGMVQILTCPRKGWHSVALKRVPARPSEDLIFGKALHAAMEWRYKECGSRAMTQAEQAQQEHVLEEFFASVEVPEESWQNIGRAKEAIAYWNAEFQQEPFIVLETERGVERELGVLSLGWCGRCQVVVEPYGLSCPFCLRDDPNFKQNDSRGTVLLIRVLFQGRLDSLVTYERKIIFHDFKKMKWKDSDRDAVRWQSSPQFRAYCWLASSMGHGEVRDYWIDSLCVRPPLVRPTKTSPPRNEFSRDQFKISDNDIEEWKRDTLKHIETWLRYCADSPPPMNLNSCAWPRKCCYWDSCSCPTEPQRMAWLNSSAYVDANFDPMAK